MSRASSAGHYKQTKKAVDISTADIAITDNQFCKKNFPACMWK